MNTKSRKKIIAIYGPTISGKTGLAVDIAKYIWNKHNLGTELISADSKKIYKDMVIGQEYPHSQKKPHMIDIINSLEKPFSLYQYKVAVEKIIDEIHKRNNLPIIYGGGAIFISAILENWNVPESYNPNTDYKKEFGKSTPKYKYMILIPEVEKLLLFKKIESSVNSKIDKGLLKEIIRLTKKYKINPLNPPTKNVLYKSIGYKEFLEHCHKTKKDLENLDKVDLYRIRKRTIKNTKDFARRQLRWPPKMEGEKHFIKKWDEAKKFVDKFILG